MPTDGQRVPSQREGGMGNTNMLAIHWDVLVVSVVVALLALLLVAQLLLRVNALQFLDVLRSARRERTIERNLGDRGSAARGRRNGRTTSSRRHVS